VAVLVTTSELAPVAGLLHSSQAAPGWDLASPGQLGAPGQALSYALLLNAGAPEGDVYQLASQSEWPAAFFDESGVLPLVDSDGDGVVDSGPLPSTGVATVTLQVRIPDEAGIGEWDRITVTATSALDPARSYTTTLLAAASPAFAQAFLDGWDAHGAPDLEAYVQLTHPEGNGTAQLTWDHHQEDAAAIVRGVDGRLLSAWQRAYFNQRGWWTADIEYAVLSSDHEGEISTFQVTDHLRSPRALLEDSPTLAVAAGGNVALAWTRVGYSGDEDCATQNVLYAVRSAAGEAIRLPSFLSTNGAAYCPTQPVSGTVRDHSPVIVTSSDDRFVVAWQHDRSTGNYYSDLHYAVLDADGEPLHGPTALITDTDRFRAAGHFDPRLLPLGEGQVLALWENPPDIHHAVFTSAGDVVRAAGNLTSDLGGHNHGADATLLPDGNILVSWIHDGNVAFALLDPTLVAVQPPTALDNSWSTTNEAVSAVATAAGEVILTWRNSDGSYLYYALLASSGQVLTPPMPFRRARGEPIAVNGQGYGNALLDFAYVEPTPTTPPVGLAPRTVLAEWFSTVRCTECVSAQLALGQLADEYGYEQLGALQYFPSTDAVGNQAGDFRGYQYFVRWIPSVFVDGGEPVVGVSADANDDWLYRQYRGMIEYQRAQQSPLEISLDAAEGPGGGAIFWSATIRPVTDVAGSNVVFRCHVYEDPVSYQEEARTYEFRYLVRALAREEHLTLGSGEVHLEGRVELLGNWNRSNLGLVVMVEDASTRRVL
jgi:hypothetical protein